ncbi:MAG: 1-acyl-sn-glycerol-3-phosphate acyltransferase [Verrucomicrobia bacterium]|nr:1-acyl-sn-glycerol-3-phosphate acyltransferase [Verrucomicrobiota bacterium]MCH8526583.1 1-acyl-sn-glycerol-3-phosphate acyltransferase [Kiritimatiellia bacterium]
MLPLLRAILFLGFVKPFVLLLLGVNARGIENMPRRGPALLAANHNSHLDTLVLLSLFPLRMLPLLRPVGARDYFHRNRASAWFSRNILRLIPLDRKPSADGPHPLSECVEALKNGEILLIFPEGSRGEPEEMRPFKTGIAHLAETLPEIPAHPVFLRGTGKALPRGEALFVPHICDIAFGEPLTWTGDRQSYMQTLRERFQALAALYPAPPPPET